MIQHSNKNIMSSITCKTHFCQKWHNIFQNYDQRLVGYQLFLGSTYIKRLKEKLIIHKIDYLQILRYLFPTFRNLQKSPLLLYHSNSLCKEKIKSVLT